MRLKSSLLSAAMVVIALTLFHNYSDGCTSILVTKKASADGSVITSHICDGNYRTWMRMEPAADYPRDTVMNIFKGRLHTEYPGSMDGVTVAGRIPQARHTYKFFDTAYPAFNEHQLAIGETTYSGRDTMVNKQGMFMIEELQRVALQRCRTAREAIALMGELIKKYGYGDGGECLTIADPKEAWIFEVQGEGPKKIGGVWAAQRIPEGEVAVSANVSRIGEIDFNDHENFMWSENVKDVARKMKLWDGKEPFSFWKAYSGGNYLKEKKNYSVRELYIMQQLAPSAGFSADMEELPVSFRPDSAVSVNRISELFGSYYEGTPLNLSARLRVPNPEKKKNPEAADSIVSPCANPWMRPDEFALFEALGDTTMRNIRTVSVPWSSYSTIIQCRDWLPDEIGCVAWVLLDNPGLSPRFPVMAGATEMPRLLDVCGQKMQRDDAALWHFRKPNRLATVRWGKSRGKIEPLRAYFSAKGARELPMIEEEYKALVSAGDTVKAVELLNGFTNDYFGAILLRWDDLERQLWIDNRNGF